MIATKELQALLERVEAATGPNLALEGEIWCAINGYQFVTWDGAGCVYRETPEAGISHVDGGVVRPYTASIDAALALVERVLASREIDLHINKPGRDWQTACIRVTPLVMLCGECATLPLAILAALLKALIAQSDQVAE